MTLTDRVKAFLWKWWIFISSFGVFEGAVILECVNCRHQFPQEELEYHLCPVGEDFEDED